MKKFNLPIKAITLFLFGTLIILFISYRQKNLSWFDDEEEEEPVPKKEEVVSFDTLRGEEIDKIPYLRSIVEERHMMSSSKSIILESHQMFGLDDTIVINGKTYILLVHGPVLTPKKKQ